MHHVIVFLWTICRRVGGRRVSRKIFSEHHGDPFATDRRLYMREAEVSQRHPGDVEIRMFFYNVNTNTGNWNSVGFPAVANTPPRAGRPQSFGPSMVRCFSSTAIKHRNSSCPPTAHSSFSQKSSSKLSLALRH